MEWQQPMWQAIFCGKGTKFFPYFADDIVKVFQDTTHRYGELDKYISGEYKKERGKK